MQVLLHILVALSLAAGGAAQAARSAYVVALAGDEVTLNVGTREGVRAGARLPIVRDGEILGLVEVRTATDTQSQGRWLPAARERIRVGDLALFDLVPSTVPPPPVTPPVTVTPPGTAPAPRTLYVSAVTSTGIALSAGAAEGVQVGQQFQVVREGKALGSVRVVSVEGHRARATVEAGTPALRVGDELRGEVATAASPPTSPAPHRPVLRETASPPTLTEPVRPKTYAVPRNDRAYDMLGALAARGLITKYPARVFYDDQILRHRPDDDLVLTRRQIAELIRDALRKVESKEAPADSQVALLLKWLTSSYAAELDLLGVDTEYTLEQLKLRAAGNRPWASGGQARVKTVGGNFGVVGHPKVTDGLRLDLRSNLWAEVADGIRFYGAVDTTADRDGLHARLQRAAVTGTWDWLTLEVGRDHFWYGPGHYGSLLLSDYASPFEYVKTRMRAGDLTYEGFVSTGLDRPDTAFMGHRVEVDYSPSVRFGLAETIVANEGRFPLDYTVTALAPILPFAVVGNVLGNAVDNPTASMYVETDIGDGFQTYVEFLIDDFVVKPSEANRNRTGLLFGSYWHDSDEPDRFNLRMEYARLDPGTYAPVDAAEQYFEGGVPLGYPLSPFSVPGTEVEDFRLEAQYKPARKLTLGFGYEWANLGFEQAVRMKQSTTRLRAAYDLSSELSASLRYRRAQVQNVGFALGAQATDSFAELELAHGF